MRLYFKKPVTTLLTSPTSSLRTLATRTSPSCSTRIPLSQILRFSPSRNPPQAKIPGAWFYLSFEVSCAAPLFPVLRRSHFALYTSLPLTFFGDYIGYNVDFIGGDSYMSAFSTVCDVFSDPDFLAPGNSFLWGLGALEEPNRERTGFLMMPKRPYEWRKDSHGCHQYDNAALGFGPRDQTAHHPVFLHLRTTNLPGPDSIMRSEHAQRRRFERRHNKHERMKRRRT